MPPRLAVLFCLLIACGGSSAPVAEPEPPPETLAECFARTGAHLYGAAWCHFCDQQLALFGPDADAVPYTDCDPDRDLELAPECVEAGLDLSGPFPTWIFPGIGRLIGVQDPRIISAVTDCPLTWEAP